MKYQYLIRENIYRLLKRVPKGLVRLLLNQYLAREKKKLDTLNSPLLLIFYITKRCNARCSHCFYWQELNTKAEELTLEQINKIASSLNYPLNTLSITGGEPFIRNDVFDIIKLFVEKNQTKKISISSNGFFTDKIKSVALKTLKEIENLAFNIQISIDGLEKKHNQIHGIDIFQRAIATIRELEKISEQYKNFQVTIQTTISKTNLDEVEELKDFVRKNFSVHHGIQFVRSAKFDTYRINPKILSGFNPKETENTLLSPRKMEKILQSFSSEKRDRHTFLSNYIRVLNEGIIRMKKSKKPFVKCLAGKYDGVIYSNGDVSLCEFVLPFANLKDFDYDFIKLWNSYEAKNIRQMTANCFCAHPCNLMNAMRYDEEVLMKVIYEDFNNC